MITTDGKNIIAKYLLNQAPEFASYIAVGVGGNAISNSSSVTFLPEDTSLNFEVVRVPVLSKGLVKEDGIEKIVFKGQLPSDQRFQITEIGLFPAESNALAERYDSKILTTFTTAETWTYASQGSGSVVSYFGDIETDVSGNILDNLPKFSFIESDSPLFEFPLRKDRNENPRYLSRAIVTPGNSASINSGFNLSASSYYVENSTVNINMGNNLPTDKIKLAVSLLSRDLESNTSPSGGVRIIVKLINNIPGTPSASASMTISSADFSSGRYKIVEKQISEFTADSNFSWSNVNAIRIYSSVVDANPEDFYLILDGLKLENISTKNPLYAMVSAEYIKTPDQYPVLKRENSISYIEYRFGLGVS